MLIFSKWTSLKWNKFKAFGLNIYYLSREKNVTNEDIKIIKCKIGSNYLYLCKLQVEFLAYYLSAVQGLVEKYRFDSSHDSLIIVIRIYTFYLNIYRQHSLLVILFISFAKIRF